MQTDPAILPVHRNPADPLRAYVHDLRNLFAVVASAKSLLERPLDTAKQRLVLDALGRVAIEGKLATDVLLAGEADYRSGASDAPAEVHNLATIIKTFERPDLRIELSTDEDPCWILMPPVDFRAVVLELVTNAAVAGAQRIQIRAKRRGQRHWLVVADDGSGFAVQASSRTPARPAGLHGTGMRRLACAARSAHGKVSIRSKLGRGSVVALILPIIGIGSAAAPEVPARIQTMGDRRGQRSAI